MLLDVIVPGPWWNAFTYNFNNNNLNLKSGSRVRIPFGNGGRVGFICGVNSSQQNNFEIKDIIEPIDENNILQFGLWELALWLGRTYLCGAGMALKAILPSQILTGEKFNFNLNINNLNKNFCERNFFDSHEYSRLDFYTEMLRRPLKNLILFPENNSANKFFKNLPDDLKDVSILWPSVGGKKLWDAWREIYSGNFKNVIAPPGGVFAPFDFDCVIVEDEASEGYLSRRTPVFSARSIAGKRALDLKAELILGGSVPSAKTFLRGNINYKNNKNLDLIFVDINRSLKVEERGIEGVLPVTVSMLERTRGELRAGHNVLWLLDRKGGAAEVFCLHCGKAVKCSKCGSIMRSEHDGKFLRCSHCNNVQEMFNKCPECGGEILSGKRPGLEVLCNAANRLIKDYKIIIHDANKKFNLKDFTQPALILGTRGALSLCSELDISLIAWLDLDAELRRSDYNARWRVFSMIWQSCRRGLSQEQIRKVLIQTRRENLKLSLNNLNWEKFWRSELETRRDLDLPPFNLLIKLNCSNKLKRESLISKLNEAGVIAMDLSDDLNINNGTLLISAPSVKNIYKILEPYFNLFNHKDYNAIKNIVIYAE